MKRLFKKLILFAVIVIAIDVCYGVALGYLHDHVKSGTMQKHNYVTRQSEDDIMMFGSSRMNYHYNPMIVEDSLGVTCFNAGEAHCGIILSYGFLTMILERYSPKMIIYDVSHFDYMIENYERNLKYLRPYYGMETIRDYIFDVSPVNRFKLMSSLYRYNSILDMIIVPYIKEQTAYQKGYIPLTKTMDYEVDLPIEKVKPIDELKIKYLHLFIQKCKDNRITLVFCASPRYKAESSVLYSPVKEVCLQENIPFLDHYCDEDFVYNKEFFADQLHLNGNGADAFTRKLVGELRPYLQL